MKSELKRVNIGCGPSPTRGWLNYDNSWSVRLAKYPLVVRVLAAVGVLTEGQRRFLSVASGGGITWANAPERIPLADDSVTVLYSSHMVEHLDRTQVRTFLQEARRVLVPGGIIRIAVPDLQKLVDEYVAEGNAESFLERTFLARPRRETLLEKLGYLVVGDRHHLWMYDGPSLCRLLTAMGFREPRTMQPGSTAIPDPGELNLYERADESVYVEAFK